MGIFRHFRKTAAAALCSQHEARALVDAGSALFAMGLKTCEAKFLAAFRCFEYLGDREQMAHVALALGRTYMHIRGLRNLQESKHWYEIALANSESDTTRAQSYGSLAIWEQQQLEEELQGQDKVPAGLRYHLTNAEQLHRQALAVLPRHEHVSLAVTHNMLAQVLTRKGAVDEALRHQRKAIREYVMAGEPERAATARVNLSSLMISAGQLENALESAEEAVDALGAIPEPARSVDWKNYHRLATKQRDSLRSHLRGKA